MDAQHIAFRSPVVYAFLTDLFGPAWPGVWVAGVPGDPNDRANVSHWRGGPAGRDAAHLGPDENLYYSVSIVKSGRRVAADFVKAPVIVIDDVGTKVDAADVVGVLGHPRWAIETSPRNEQWVYRLKDPIEDPRVFERIMRAIAAKGLTDPGTIDVVRAMRLPAGINGKPKYGFPAPNVKASTGPNEGGDDIDFTALCLALGLDPIEMSDPDSWAAPVSSSLKVGGTADLSKPDLMLSALQDLDRVLGPGREVGVVDIECPFSDEHTAREDSGTAYFGRGAFKCHHGHCQGKTNWDFKAKVRELYDAKNGSAALAGLAFACEQVDDDRADTLADEAKAKARAEAAEEHQALTEMGSRYALVHGEKSIIDVRGTVTSAISRVSREAFTLVNDAVMRIGKGRACVGLGTHCLKTPGVLPIYERIDMVDPPGSEGAGVLNIWRGFAIAPKAGAWPRIERLVRDGLADGDAAIAEHILNWVAWGFQHPLERGGTTLCLIGRQGTGKSAFGNILRTIYGTRYSIHASADNDLVGTFNDRLENRLLFVGDEAVFGGDPRIKGKLKSLITEPTIRAEGKYRDAKEVPNRLKFFFTSNEEAALPVEPGDRRSTVVRVSDRFKGDHAFWNNFFANLDAELPAFLHDMLARDLRGFEHRKPLSTAAKADMAEATASPLVRFLLERIESGTAPGADGLLGLNGQADDWEIGPVRVPVAELFDDFEAWARRKGARHLPARSALGHELQGVIAGITVARPSIGKRQVRTYTLPSRDECRRGIRRALGADDDSS